MYEFRIAIDKSAIERDVRNETHKIGKGRQGGDTPQQVVSNLQADDLSQDALIVGNSIRRSMERVVGDLSKFIHDVEPTHDSNVTAIVFRMSSYYNPTSDGDVEESIRSYIKNMAICDFIKLTLQREAQLYRNEAEVSLLHVKRILNNKKWRT